MRPCLNNYKSFKIIELVYFVQCTFKFMQNYPKLDNTSLTATLFTFHKACHPLTSYTKTL